MSEFLTLLLALRSWIRISFIPKNTDAHDLEVSTTRYPREQHQENTNSLIPESLLVRKSRESARVGCCYQSGRRRIDLRSGGSICADHLA